MIFSIKYPFFCTFIFSARQTQKQKLLFVSIIDEKESEVKRQIDKRGKDT
ncbi:MAG: hypothetical protein KHY31_08005 [Clostridiales bacterium]|nr:hypothetical protein [Clostridiales bacterium]